MFLSPRDLAGTPELTLTLAAAQAVHKDIESGRTLAQTQRDLDFAKGSLRSVSGADYDQAAAAVASAQRDFDNYASKQDQGASAASGFDSATKPPVTTAIDTGSGSTLWNAWSGFANDISFGRSNGGGEYDAKGALNLRSTPGVGTEGKPISCALLPQPLAWMCENPKATAGIAAGVLGALFLGPTLIERARAFKKATR